MIKNNNERLLLIEEFSIMSFIYFLIFRKKKWTFFYIHINNRMKNLYKKPFFFKRLKGNIKKIEFGDLPGSAFITEEEGYQKAVDTVFEKYKTNCYVKICLNFCIDPLYLLALKREFYNLYTYKRIKTFTIIKFLSEKYPNHPITFIPLDNENIVSCMSESLTNNFSYSIPKSIIIINYFRSAIISILSFVSFFFALYKIGKMYYQRLDWNSHIQSYNFALDNFSGGIFQKSYDFFLFFDFKIFHPAKTLQVIRGSFGSSLNEKKTKSFFDSHQIPYIEMDNLKCPSSIFYPLICKKFFFGNVSFLLQHLFFSGYKSLLFWPSLNVMQMKIDAEIFYHQYDVKVFIARDEYAPHHIVRTLVAREHGNATIGFSHGDDCHHATYLNYIVCEKFAVWGDFYKIFLEKSLKYSEPVIIGAGIYGLDKTYNWQMQNKVPLRYKSIKKKYKLIGIFGSSFSPEIFVTKEMTIKYFETVLNLTDQYEGYYRIIKSKEKELNDPEFREVIKGHKNVIIEENIWTYRLLPILDVCICSNSTSIGIESLVAGKKVFYYDVSNDMYHPYAKYHDSLVAFDEKQLDQNLQKYFIEGQYLPQEIINKIALLHGYKFDGNVVNRFRECCLDLLNKDKEKLKG